MSDSFNSVRTSAVWAGKLALDEVYTLRSKNAAWSPSR